MYLLSTLILKMAPWRQLASSLWNCLCYHICIHIAQKHQGTEVVRNTADIVVEKQLSRRHYWIKCWHSLLGGTECTICVIAKWAFPRYLSFPVSIHFHKMLLTLINHYIFNWYWNITFDWEADNKGTVAIITQALLVFTNIWYYLKLLQYWPKNLFQPEVIYMNTVNQFWGALIDMFSRSCKWISTSTHS